MQFLSSILVTLLVALSGISARKERDYTALAAAKLMSKPLQCASGCEVGGGSPLPRKPSESQCSLALQRIVKQPQNCGQKYLSGAARNVYLPVYNWFGNDVVQVAQQYALDNGVGVEVYDAFGSEVASISTTGTVLTPSTEKTFNIATERTWALNYPTYYTSSSTGLGYLAQNVYSFDGKILLVVISKELVLLPQVC